MRSSSARVAVIGGGYAGMSAGVALSDAGLATTVFEASGTLGGRARRVMVEGLPLDNGLHILIGAYRDTLSMMARVAPGRTDALLRLPLELEIHGRFRLKAGRLPAPLNVLQGLVSADGLDTLDKWSIARLMTSLRVRRHVVEPDVSVSAFLAQHHQTSRACRLLWEPLCVAALNTQAAQASMRTFAAVLRDAFAPPAANCDLLLPTVDFSRLFPEPAADHITRLGGQVRLNQRVRQLRDDGSGVRIALSDGDATFDAAIIAVAPQHVAALAQAEPGLADSISDIARFRYRPIHSIYLQYPFEVRMPRPMLGLDARYVQWVFDRGQLGGPRGLLGVVISAEGAHEELPHSVLAQAVHEELKLAFSGLPAPQWHRVIAEQRATIASTVDLRRPTVQTGSGRIFLAGDYVETGYPATLETAVRSGISAAKRAVERVRTP